MAASRESRGTRIRAAAGPIVDRLGSSRVVFRSAARRLCSHLGASSYGIAMVGTLLAFRGRGKGIAICLAGFALVLAWWLTLKPSNDRAWQPDVAQTAWAEIDGDHVTIHNVRNCDYRTEGDYTPHWETRSYDLSQIRGMDIFLTYWGSPWIAHPIVSFQFGDNDYIAMSIETRKEVGEQYSAIRGFFRYYELIYTVSDERDVVRLRTNYRKGEETYLFHTLATPEHARSTFLNYLKKINRIRNRPEWYNALTNNCTTNIATLAGEPQLDWRVLLNGRADQMLYETRRSGDGKSSVRPAQAAGAHQRRSAGGERCPRFLPPYPGRPRGLLKPRST